MALAKKCDRCGVHYDPYTRYGSKEENINSVYAASSSDDGQDYIAITHIDLCEKCLNSFAKWLSGQEPQEPDIGLPDEGDKPEPEKSEYLLNDIKFEDVTAVYNPLRYHKAEIEGDVPEGIEITYVNNQRSGADVGRQEAKVIFNIIEGSELSMKYDRINVNGTNGNFLTCYITVEDDDEPGEGEIKGPGESEHKGPNGSTETP